MNVLNRYARWTYVAVMLAVVGMTGACGSAPPEIHHYMLDIAPSQSTGEAAQRPVLGIEQFSADAAYDESQIAYRKSPYTVNYYYYHRWAATPGLLLTDAMRRGYDKSGLFQSVMAGQIARADVILTGHVSAIEEIDVSEEQWVGHVVLDLRLRDGRTGTLLWTKSFDERAPMSERSPTGLAQAVSKVVTKIVEQSAPQIAQVARQAGAGM